MHYHTSETYKKIPIRINGDLQKHLDGINFDKLIIITDHTVHRLRWEELENSLTKYNKKTYCIVPWEKQKNFNTYESLCNNILNDQITKKSLIVAFGWWVVWNIAWFVAATLFRWIRFIHIPTTIIAQADSVIWWKQAINSQHWKNTIWIFHEPEFIFIESKYLKTLPQREIKCWISECIKHALCQSTNLLHTLESIKEQDNIDKLSIIIQKTIELKLGVIAKDRKEHNEGKVLVYWHTIWHAIETLAQWKLLHWEAISIGMCCVAHISHNLWYLSTQELKKHYDIFNHRSLPTKIPKYITIESIIDKLHYDKKRKESGIEFVLLWKIGEVLTNNNKVWTIITEKEIKSTLQMCY